MTKDQLQELYDVRMKLTTDSRGILDAAHERDKPLPEDERCGLQAEEQQQWDRMDARINVLDVQIEREETQAKRESAEVSARVRAGDRGAVVDSGLRLGEDPDHPGWRKFTESDQPRAHTYTLPHTGKQRTIKLGHGLNSTPEYGQAFSSYLAGQRLTPEMMGVMQVDSDVGGGFIAAFDTFNARLIQGVDEKLIIRELATTFTVDYAETLGFASLDQDVSDIVFGAGELTAAVEDAGLEFGKREFKVHSIVPKVIKISKRLLQSPRMNVEQLVLDRMGLATARGLETAYMTGGGAEEPLGLYTPHADGIPAGDDFILANATTITADELFEIQGKLPDGYQAVARWMFHRNTITKIRKLKNGDGLYIFQPGLQSGTPNQILGNPYITGDKVPKTMTAGNYIGMYADFSNYWIADAISMQVQRLLEKYALTQQIGLLFSNMAADAMPVLSEAFVRIRMR